MDTRVLMAALILLHGILIVWFLEVVTHLGEQALRRFRPDLFKDK